jgi:hypothetical protein
MNLDKIHTPYFDDYQLLKSLGIEPWKVKLSERKYVGEYKLPEYDQAKIKIWVSCIGAIYFDFEIITDDDTCFTAKCSGNLHEYWDSLLLMAKGNMTVERSKFNVEDIMKSKHYDEICLKIENPRMLFAVQQFLTHHNQPVYFNSHGFDLLSTENNWLQYSNGFWILSLRNNKAVLTFEEFKEQIMYSQSKANDTRG